MKYRIKEVRVVHTEPLIELGGIRLKHSARPLYLIQERSWFFWFWWDTIESTFDKSEAEQYLKALLETELYQ